jgi:mono/diheme cytochrome c family protein
MGKSDGLEIISVFEKTPVNDWSKDAHKYAKSHLSEEPLRPEPIIFVKVPEHLKKAPKQLQKSYQRGEKAYHHAENCVICHGEQGEGNPAIMTPPLDGSRWVTEDKERLTKIALHGLMGEIEVKGKKYNGVMAGYNGRIPNQEIADILTYVRNAWSNKAGDAVTKKEVDQVQKETDEQTSKGPFQAADLLKAHPFK